MGTTKRQKTVQKRTTKPKESIVSNKTIANVVIEDLEVIATVKADEYAEELAKTEPDPVICKAGEAINLKEVELTKTINRYCQSFKMNINGYNMYECLGITPEEFDDFKLQIRKHTSRSVRKAQKVSDFVNEILNDKTKIATLVWLILN